MTRKPFLIFDAGGVLVFPDFDLLAQIGNQARLGAIHLHKMGLYHNWDGIHIPNIQQLSGLFAKMDESLHDFDLFPAREFKID